MPKISVIIPVYNEEKHLSKCLDSVISQTLEDIEIICIDDGSNDASQDILKKYEESDMRIKVITQRHQGLPSARNTGLATAKGEYIGFVDSDDWIEPNTYEYAYQKMKQYDVDMVCWGANVITEDDYVISPDYLDYQKIHLTGIRPYDAYAYMNSTVNIWNKLFKSSIIMDNNIRFLDNYIFEDNDFLAKYVLFCKNVFYSDQYLYNHLKHQNSITGDIANRKNQHLIYIDLYISTYDFYKEHDAVIKNK